MRKLLPILCLLACFAFKKNVFGQSSFAVKDPVDLTSNANDYKKNIEVYTEALKNKSQAKSEVARLHFLRGMNEHALNEYDKAISDYTVTISLSPLYSDAYSYQADDYKLTKNYQLAINDYKKLVLLIKDDSARSAFTYNNMAFVQRQLGQYKNAIQSCSQAIAMDSNYGAAYANRAELYNLTGQFQLAVNDFSTAMRGYQSNSRLLSVLFSERADSRRMLKQYIDAINDYSYAIGLNPGNKISYWNRAATYDLNSDYQLADEDYSRAIIFYKGDNISLSRLYSDRAQMEIRLHQSKKAIENDAISILLDNKFADAYLCMAEAYAQNGDHQLSINYYNKAIRLVRNNRHVLSIIYNGLAREAYFLNNYQKVIVASTLAIKMDATAWGPYLNRGKAYLKQMNKKLAIRDFNKVLAMDTAKQSFEYAFALFYTGQPDKAINVMQNKLLLTTDSAVLIGCYYNLACLFSLMNKPEEANIYLKKCIEAGYAKRYVLADANLENINSTQVFQDIISNDLTK